VENVQTGAQRARDEHQPPNDIFVPHAFPEAQVDLGEVVMNYAVAGAPDKPALLLLPGQTESWWGFEGAMKILEKDFRVFAVDLRGQGRSTRTPGRYTIDNMGNDVVRFVQQVIKRPVIVSGCSSGGVITAWLSAYAPVGMLRGAHYEDPPLFASELTPALGHSVRQSVVGPMFARMMTHLGNQWRVGDWNGMRGQAGGGAKRYDESAPQNLREYDPEWGRAFWEGTVAQSAPHHAMLMRVKVPVLFTHHARMIDEKNGTLIGAISDLQAAKVRELVEGAGQPCEYVSLPDAAHAMHAADPARYADVLTGWARSLPA
jgi:pimeloyl-ACP methyl ester carboxylesterase